MFEERQKKSDNAGGKVSDLAAIELPTGTCCIAGICCTNL